MRVFIYSYGVPTEEYPLNGIFAYDQAKALSNKGIEVFLLFVDLRSIRRIRKLGVHRFSSHGIDVIGISFPLGRVPGLILDLFDSVLFKILLLKAIFEFGTPDIIHSHFLRQSVSLSNSSSLLTSTKMVATLHDDNLVAKLAKHKIRSISKLVSNFDKVYVVSQSVKINLEKEGFKTYLINNVVDFKTFSYKKNAKRDLILSAGHLEHRKGMDVLIEAWSISNLKDRNKLLIIGDGPEKGKLLKKVNDLELNESISFYGSYNRDFFSEVLDSALLFVLASRSESFGLVYAEALASGVPVVGTLCGGPEGLVNYSNGILVNIDDHLMLAKAIDDITLKIEQFDRQAISNSIKNTFELNVVIEGLIGDYLNIINQ